MHIATVIGNVWATHKDPSLEGLRFLVVRPFTTAGEPASETMIAVDPLGAAIGQRVLVVHGRAARHAIGRGHDIGFQTAVAAIIDQMELADGRLIGPVSELDRPAPAAQSGAQNSSSNSPKSAPPT